MMTPPPGQADPLPPSAAASPATALSGPVKAPVFSVQLELRDGRIGPVAGSAALEWPDPRTRVAFSGEFCGRTEASLVQELLAYVQAQFARRGKVLEEITRSTKSPERARQLEQLASTDEETRKLWAGETWPIDAAAMLLEAWRTRMAAKHPTMMLNSMDMDGLMADLHEDNKTLAEGPLLPLPRSMGRLKYVLAPPHLRPRVTATANVAQWLPLLDELQDIADRRQCKLWYRDAVAEPMADYLDARGMAVSSVLTERDHRNAAALGAWSVANPEQSNLRVERPVWTPAANPQEAAASGFVGGGRILLEPAPYLQTIYLQGSPLEIMKGLYLLLPSADYDRVLQAKERYLCATQAYWRPPGEEPAVQLPLDDSMPGLDGSSLSVAHQSFGRDQLADRVQRLQAYGLNASLAEFNGVRGPELGERRGRRPSPMLHRAVLRLESSQAQAPGEVLPGLRSCQTPRDPPITDCAADEGRSGCAPHAEARNLRAGDLEPEPVARELRVLKNHLRFGAAWPSGRPPKLTAQYAHDGLLPGDSFQVELGEQSKTSGQASYTRDFVGFPWLSRRLQLSGKVFSQFAPERAVQTGAPDERRQGVELRGRLDLFRDHGGFAQADFGASRSRITLKAASDLTTTASLLDLNLVLAQSRPWTPAGWRGEIVAGLAHGRADGRRYQRYTAEAVAQTMLGALDRATIRLKWGRIAGEPPLAEYLPFGGPDSVRGYREDSITGRRVYSAQLEYSRPAPWMPSDQELARLIRRKLALAVFADLGEVQGSPTQSDGRRYAAGLGLRFRYDEGITLRLDAARPVGSVPAGEQGLRLQFGLVYLQKL
ncbi:BamA/TamA family outer membrane protein [Roseateles sp. DB2]|uniref:BamA/TamA family outer membrane protein n=1 Tax=Roseateles sp. DB2 TaxID=3453717 RepID=UPI003F70C25D